jgi:hypothetical protein
VIQIIHGKTYGDKGSGTPVTTLRGNLWSNELGGETSAVFKHSQCWSVAGTFRNLYAQILAPVENSASIYWTATTYTLMVNGVATALTATVPAAGPVAQNGFDAAASDTFHEVTVAAGDVIAIQRSPAETLHGVTNAEYAHQDWSLTFEADADNYSGYGAGSQGSRISGTTAWCAPFNCQQSAFIPVAASDTIGQTEIHSINPVAGSIRRCDIQFERAPGAGKSYTFHFFVNGVKQDGSGGTVDTAMVIANTDLAVIGAFDLPVVPLDLVSINCTATSGSPQSTFAQVSIGFRATTDGESALCFNSATGQPIQDGSTDWAGAQLSGWAWTTSRSPTPAPAWRPARWPSTELLVSLPGAIDPFTLKGFCINLSTAPGVGNSFTFTTRQAFADTLSVVLMENATDPDSRLLTDPGNHEVDFALTSDRLDIQAVGASTPVASHVGWAWLMVTATTPPPPPPTIVTYQPRWLRRFALPFSQNKWLFISRFELIMQAGVGLSGTAATVQGYDPIVMFRLSRDGGQTWDTELTMSMGKLGEYGYRAFLNRLGRARNPVVELTGSDPVFVTLLDAVVDIEEGSS